MRCEHPPQLHGRPIPACAPFAQICPQDGDGFVHASFSERSDELMGEGASIWHGEAEGRLAAKAENLEPCRQQVKFPRVLGSQFDRVSYLPGFRAFKGPACAVCRHVGGEKG